ncbi:nucleotidyltransferase family protein [Azospirillum endophyticum]
MMNPVRLRALDTVRHIIFKHLAEHPARVYLFGSCARGDGGHWSDIDVAIDPLEPLPPGLIGKINEELEESTVPYFVDVLDLSTVRSSYREDVERDGIEWVR